MTTDQTLYDILGLADVPETERDEMLIRIGELVIESAVTQVVACLNERDTAAFEKFVSLDPKPEALINELRRISPDIDDIIREEAQVFKEECIRIINRQVESATQHTSTSHITATATP